MAIGGPYHELHDEDDYNAVYDAKYIRHLITVGTGNNRKIKQFDSLYSWETILKHYKNFIKRTASALSLSEYIHQRHIVNDYQAPTIHDI